MLFCVKDVVLFSKKLTVCFFPSGQMEDMDEKYLYELENRLREAEKDLKTTDLDARVGQLEKMNDEQKLWIKSYEDEVAKLASDVANIAKIRESLPNGCFRRLHLEP